MSSMKAGSDNFRVGSVQGVMRRVKERGVPVIVVEPALDAPEFFGSEVLHDLRQFKRRSLLDSLAPGLREVIGMRVAMSCLTFENVESARIW